MTASISGSVVVSKRRARRFRRFGFASAAAARAATERSSRASSISPSLSMTLCVSISFFVSRSGSSSPSIKPRSAAAFALRSRHGADGDAASFGDPANPTGRLLAFEAMDEVDSSDCRELLK
jgi:hypothetical protein